MTEEAVLPVRRAGPKGQLGWISFEMAGGPYYNMIRIFVFAPYFTSVLVGNTVKGQEIWGYVESASGFAVALFAALAGSFAEAYGPRKPGIGIFTAILIVSLALLWNSAPGTPVMNTAILLIIAAAVIEFAFMYHNSLLALIAPAGRIGLLSGLGYSGNYLGTLIIIIPWLFLIGNANPPAFGLDPTTGEHVRIVGPIAAAWFLLCALPFFFFTPDAPRTGNGFFQSFGVGVAQLVRTIASARHYSNILRYLIARMIYYDGLVATFTFVGIFASGVFGWDIAKVTAYGLVIFSILVFAGFIGGIIDDLIGSKNTILLGLFVTASSVLFSLSLGPDHIFFNVMVPPSQNSAGLPIIGELFKSFSFTTTTEQAFVLSGVIGGIFMGPALASSRTMLARIAPIDKMAEFFGLYTLTGKATSFIAPFAIAIVTHLTHDLRFGFGVVLAFMLVGFLGLLTVREERSIAAD